MRGPVASVTCHDPGRRELAARLRAAVTTAGLTGWVSEAAGTDGTIAVLEVPVGELGLGPVDHGEGWARLSQQLGRVLDDVEPAIALGAFGATLDLDDPAWQVDRLTWCSGRVDVARLDADRIARFNALAGERLVEVRGGAVRWATPPGVPLGVGLLDVAPLGLAAAAYEAWTGEAADLAPPTGVVDDANAPVLWCWTDGEPARMVEAIAVALPDHEVDAEQEYGALSPVVVRPPAGRVGLAELLDDVRSVAATGTSAWVGLLPRGGFLPPGVAPDLPESAVVDHLWLRGDWAGDLLPAVADVLGGAPREDLAGGVLITTGPDPRGPADVDVVWTPMVRHQRLVAVAALLGERLRTDTAGPGIVI